MQYLQAFWIVLSALVTFLVSRFWYVQKIRAIDTRYEVVQCGHKIKRAEFGMYITERQLQEDTGEWLLRATRGKVLEELSRGLMQYATVTVEKRLEDRATEITAYIDFCVPEKLPPRGGALK